MAEINNVNSSLVNLNWQQLTAKEIIKKEKEGAVPPSEILRWAEEISRLTNTPDDVTYETARGETDIDKLNELLNGSILQDEINPVEIDNQNENDGLNEPNNIFETEYDNNQNIEDNLTLQDTNITTDAETIIKRKEKKGLM